MTDVKGNNLKAEEWLQECLRKAIEKVYNLASKRVTSWNVILDLLTYFRQYFTNTSQVANKSHMDHLLYMYLWKQ